MATGGSPCRRGLRSQRGRERWRDCDCTMLNLRTAFFQRRPSAYLPMMQRAMRACLQVVKGWLVVPQACRGLCVVSAADAGLGWSGDAVGALRDGGAADVNATLACHPFTVCDGAVDGFQRHQEACRGSGDLVHRPLRPRTARQRPMSLSRASVRLPASCCGRDAQLTLFSPRRRFRPSAGRSGNSRNRRLGVAAPVSWPVLAPRRPVHRVRRRQR